MSDMACQLEELIRRIVREEIAAQAAPELTKEAYSEKEFCKLVGISQDMGRRMRLRGELKFIQAGRRVLYTPTHIREFLSRHEENRN